MFSPNYSKFYSLSCPTPRIDELARILEYARIAKGPILEAMCGAGRFLASVLELRGNAEGLDACPHMLELCREKADCPLYCQKIEEMALPQKYGLIYITTKSLCMVEEKSLPQVFQKVRSHLAPGGFFLFDLWGPLDPQFPASHTERYRIQDLQVEESFHFDCAKQLFQTATRYNGAEDRAIIQLHEKKKILPLLENANLSLLNTQDRIDFAKLGEHVFAKRSFSLDCKAI